MGWFTRMCRDVGLMIHHVRRPDHRTVSRRQHVEEKKRGKMTLRRTTIEEIEVENQDSASEGCNNGDRSG